MIHPRWRNQLVLLAIVAALYGAYKIWEALEWRS
jgi:hypothetical protein